tara:strand:- start:284 stop:1498 length:1215 start_codon:yes stop_codon:yes gene_type:complete
MAITDKEQGVWNLEEVYNKINQGGIWSYTAPSATYVWGGNSYGFLGQNDRTNRSSPIQLPGEWSRMGSGAYAQGGIKTDGTMWMWGNNFKGMLGLNDPAGPGPAGNAPARSSPAQLPGDWAAGTWGEYCSMAIKTNGTLWAWGYNVGGVLGLNDQIPWPTGGESSPRQVGTDTTWSSTVKHLSTGYNASGAIKTDGTLWCWGSNNPGILGQNDRTSRSSPVQVGSDTTWSVLTGVSAVGAHAIKTDGSLWSWGNNNLGNLGLNNRTYLSSPTQIGTNTNWAIVNSIALQATIATKTDGTLWTWGSNEAGELGLNEGGPTKNISSPTQIGSGTDWSDARAFRRNVAAVKTDGTMYGWGANYNGTVGANTGSVKYSSPTQIPGTWDISFVTGADTSAQISIGKKIL